MAKITITIEDVPGDKVKVDFRPKVLELAEHIKANGGTSAMSYAVSTATFLMNESKKLDKGKKAFGLILPPGTRT